MRRKLVYVIHHHFAKREHWDIRLEREGVLKSWAAPKEPPTEVGVKRLAVRVADHPLEYAKFEGIILPGHYGAGRVAIWDSGVYEPLEWTDSTIVVRLAGKRLKGEWCLVQFRPPKGWLLFRRA